MIICSSEEWSSRPNSRHLGFYESTSPHSASLRTTTGVGDGQLEALNVPFRDIWPAELDLTARLAGMTPVTSWFHRLSWSNALLRMRPRCRRLAATGTGAASAGARGRRSHPLRTSSSSGSR
jgi:hypothetical protein